MPDKGALLTAGSKKQSLLSVFSTVATAIIRDDVIIKDIRSLHVRGTRSSPFRSRKLTCLCLSPTDKDQSPSLSARSKVKHEEMQHTLRVV